MGDATHPWCFGWDLNPHACAEVFETPLSADSSTETYMLVFPSRHCLRRSLLYFKHHVVHMVIFTIADCRTDNILRIWVQLASAKISVGFSVNFHCIFVPSGLIFRHPIEKALKTNSGKSNRIVSLFECFINTY